MYSLCYIPNSETCLRHVWLQYYIKSPQLFGLICVQNSVGSLVLYNRLNSTKSPWLFKSKSMVIFICIHCLIISFKLCKFTRTLHRVFLSPNLNSYIVFHWYSWLGIQFPYHISHQAWSSPIVLIMLLYLSPASIYFPMGTFFINSLVYSVCLFSLTSSFSTLFGVFFQNFQTSFHFKFLIFLLTHLNHRK